MDPDHLGAEAHHQQERGASGSPKVSYSISMPLAGARMAGMFTVDRGRVKRRGPRLPPGGTVPARGAHAGPGPTRTVPDRASTRSPVLEPGSCRGRQNRPNLPDGSCPFCPGGRRLPTTTTRSPSPTDGLRSRAIGPRSSCTPRITRPRFADLSGAQARRVVDLWAERSVALGSRPDVDYVLVFENHGPEVGATIAHPHGQIYASTPFHRPRPPSSGRATRGRPRTGGTGRSAGRHGRGGWRAWVPVGHMAVRADPRPGGAGRRPPVARPRRARRAGVGLLVDVLARLDQLFDTPDAVHDVVAPAPLRRRRLALGASCTQIAVSSGRPWRARFVAAGELGSGVCINPVARYEAAGRPGVG